jgi:hypothetical protein
MNILFIKMIYSNKNRKGSIDLKKNCNFVLKNFKEILVKLKPQPFIKNSNEKLA